MYILKIFSTIFLACCIIIRVFGDIEDDSYNALEIDSTFSCPPNEVISPCMCHSVPPIPTIHCSGVRSLKTMSRTLESTFIEYPIPYLKIRDCNPIGLPSRAFNNLNITRLLISNSNLTFVAPDAFDGLESLLSLVLHNVMLYDFPTISLSRLPSLIVLSLVGNKLSKLSQRDMINLDGVKYFGLRDNRLTNIERGSFPHGLVTLSLSQNHLLNLNNSLRNMPYLETLYLDDNRIMSIDGELEGLVSLKHFYASGNLLRTLGNAFKHVPNLKILELQCNGIYDLGDALKGLRKLQSLNLTRNFLSTLNDAFLQDLVSLENLDLSKNYIASLDGLMLPFVNLVVLDISDNSISNFTFGEIETLSRLKVLNLDENRLTALSGVRDSSRTISLQMLFASKNDIHCLNNFLAHFPNLEVVDISWNNIHRLYTSDFDDTPRLEYVNVEGNPLMCDLHQLHVYHSLENRTIELDGIPQCNVMPLQL